MDKSNIIYRLRDGVLHFSKGVELNFVTGFIYEDQGEYIIEIHFHSDTDLEGLYCNNKDRLFNFSSIKCVTSDGAICTINKVLPAPGNFPVQELWGNFNTYGKIIIEKKKKGFSLEEQKKQIGNGSIKYLKVKYLKLKHSIWSTSYREFERFGRKIKEPYNDKAKAYTPIEFYYKGNKYGFHIKDDKESKDEHIIDFHVDKQNYSSLEYEDWLHIKNDFIHFLSFFNGAAVIVKNEYYGETYQLSKIDSAKINYYSFNDKLHRPNKWSDFFLLDSDEYCSYNYLQKAFDRFSDYIELNKKLGLNTIIWYLNLSWRNISFEERIFIQTITLERLSKYYIKSQDVKKHEALIDQEIFKELKSDLFLVLEKYKDRIPNDDDKIYDKLKSQIGGVNQINRGKTIEQFKYLIESLHIPISEDIEKLLKKRNDIIHEGDIGEDEIGKKNYFLMDELLRGIIAKLIGYEGGVKKGKIKWDNL